MIPIESEIASAGKTMLNVKNYARTRVCKTAAEICQSHSCQMTYLREREKHRGHPSLQMYFISNENSIFLFIAHFKLHKNNC